MKIAEAKWLADVFLKLDSDSKQSLEKAFDLMGDEVSPHSVAIAFANFVADKLREDHYPHSRSIFTDVENMLADGAISESIKEALCTCFLETLVNVASYDETIFPKFIPFLGPESVGYCRAWDIFTGAKAPGLWGEEGAPVNPISKVEALEIVKKLSNKDYSNVVEENAKIELIERNFPGICRLIFHNQAKLTAEEIFETAKKSENTDSH